MHIIYRQTDQDLISAINELSQGSISDATKTIVQSLSRPLPNTGKDFKILKHLGLKIGVKVILQTNLSDDLVNGKMGIVHSIEGELLHIMFKVNGKYIICPIRKFTFTTYDPVSKSIISKRVQFSLKPAYGLTIHKSQGMSLNHVLVNCQNCSIPGQIGVAVGRATSIDGLQIVNCKSSHVCEYEQSVYA